MMAKVPPQADGAKSKKKWPDTEVKFNLLKGTDMLENKELVSLNNLGEGAAAELFDLELHRVLDNIQDVNTKATTKRVITLKVTLQPDEHRNFGVTEIACICQVGRGETLPDAVGIWAGVSREVCSHRIRCQAVRPFSATETR